jgi:HSP20 family protein
MALNLRTDPLLAELQTLGEDMDRMTGRMFASDPARKGWIPPADIYETDDDVVIEMDVPGCHSENLSVEAIDGQLVVSGERSPADSVARRYRVERWSGRFVRSFTLQPNLNTGEIRADYHDGVLTVRLRKTGRGQAEAHLDHKRAQADHRQVQVIAAGGGG